MLIFRCPLYSDTNLLHKTAVLKGAEEAKREVGATNLKVDPAADIAKYYKKTRNHNQNAHHHQQLQVVVVSNCYFCPLKDGRLKVPVEELFNTIISNC